MYSLNRKQYFFLRKEFRLKLILQLCCTLKQRSPYHHKSVYQVGALLLLVLFLSTSFVRFSHVHGRFLKTDHTYCVKYQKHLHSADKCKWCEHVHHKHGKDLLGRNNLCTLLIPLTLLVTYRTDHNTGSCIFTLQGFTNKGPPQFHTL